MIDLTCEICGNSFPVKPYRAKTARFCSQICGGEWHARSRLNTGAKPYMIGNKHRAGIRPTNAFTPDAVRGDKNPRWQTGVELTCQHCGALFHQKPWLARQNGVARFCGPACFQASGLFDGAKSPTWVGGITTYRGKGWLEIRATVVAEQEGCCAECGRHVGSSMPVHHIRPFRLYASAAEANARNNLVGLCQPCHMRAERKAG